LLTWFDPPPPCLRHTVLVTLKSETETALKGVLWDTRRPWLVLRNVFLVRDDNSPAVRMDGEVIVHRDNVAFLQVLHAGDQ
jgi:small nuclear ribonucleoprotein (snRNP)-like protein